MSSWETVCRKCGRGLGVQTTVDDICYSCGVRENEHERNREQARKELEEINKKEKREIESHYRR